MKLAQQCLADIGGDLTHYEEAVDNGLAAWLGTAIDRRDRKLPRSRLIYDPATTRSQAERLRSWIAERFPVTLGRWHDVKVGPHDQAMYQVAFATRYFLRRYRG